MTELATRSTDDIAAAGAGGALALYPGQTSWTEEQEAALVQLGLGEAPDADRLVFLHVAQRSGLDPFARQIYMIGRHDSQLGAKRWTIQTGIDGFRAKAEEHEQYAGQLPIQWCGEDGVWVDVWLARKKPTAARARILRHDRDQPTVATCLFEEFAQYKSGNSLTQMWDTKGVHMIGKCAEAGGLRAAFPQTFSGLVTEDEAHGLDRQARSTRVPSERVEHGPVDVGELTGQPTAPPATAKASPPRRPSTEPRHAPALAGGSGKATKQHTDRLFAALRRDDAPDESKEWATAVLGREVNTWHGLTADEANLLIGKLEVGDLSTGPAGGDGGEIEQLDAERDAARADG